MTHVKPFADIHPASTTSTDGGRPTAARQQAGQGRPPKGLQGRGNGGKGEVRVGHQPHCPGTAKVHEHHSCICSPLCRRHALGLLPALRLI